jgi:hypothetical protein
MTRAWSLLIVSFFLDNLASEISEVADYSLRRTIPQPSTITQPSPTIPQPIPTISKGNPLPELQKLAMAERVAKAPSPRPGPSTSQKPVDQASKNMNELVQHWQKSNLISVPREYTPPWVGQREDEKSI